MSAPPVDALRGTLMGGANFEFKSKYLRIIEIALLIAGAVHAIAFLTVPPYKMKPYQLRERKMQAIDVPDDIVVPPPPKEIERPALPSELEISEDVGLDETIPDTDFNPFAPPVIPDDSGSDAAAFYAFDTRPEPIKTVAPQYPELARAAGAEGLVWVEVTIDESGRVISARVVSSTTIQSLNEAAREAAMGWLFTPAKQRDTPVKARISIPFEFALRSS